MLRVNTPYCLILLDFLSQERIKRLEFFLGTSLSFFVFALLFADDFWKEFEEFCPDLAPDYNLQPF